MTSTRPLRAATFEQLGVDARRKAAADLQEESRNSGAPVHIRLHNGDARELDWIQMRRFISSSLLLLIGH